MINSDGVGKGKFDCVDLFGIPIARVTLDEAVDLIAQSIATRTPLNIGVVNAAKVVNMQSDEHLRDSVQSSDVIFADGMSIVWSSRLLRRSLPERVTGIDLMLETLRRGQQDAYRVFCLGAEEWVSAKVQEIIETKFPGLILAGRRNGYFSEDEEAAVAEEVRQSRADVLFVAMTSPKKENFMSKWNAHMQVPVVHGVGGSFDVIAGKVRRAPHIWQRLGIEWLYRVVQEPGRLWRRYLLTNLAFARLVFRELRSTPVRKVDGGVS